MSWKFTDELSVTFQSSVSGASEFGLRHMLCQISVPMKDLIGQICEILIHQLKSTAELTHD